MPLIIPSKSVTARVLIKFRAEQQADWTHARAFLLLYFFAFGDRNIEIMSQSLVKKMVSCTQETIGMRMSRQNVKTVPLPQMS